MGIFFYLKRLTLLVLFFSQIAIQLICSLVFYFKNRNLESKWNKSLLMRYDFRINKLTKVKIFQLDIGDLLLIRSGTISPADVLILDSSEFKMGRKIFYTNERRINGKNIFHTKASIRDMIKAESLSEYRSPQRTVKDLRTNINFKLTYDKPNANITNFRGLIKIDNDPKSYDITKSNILLCGTKLHTKWILGYVIYNGKNTKIMKRNFRKKSSNFKISEIETLCNKFTLFCFFLQVIQATLSFIYLYSNSGYATDLKKIVSLNPFNTALRFYLRYFLNFGSLIYMLLDLITLAYSFQLERLKPEDQGELDFFNRNKNRKQSQGNLTEADYNLKEKLDHSRSQASPLKQPKSDLDLNQNIKNSKITENKNKLQIEDSENPLPKENEEVKLEAPTASVKNDSIFMNSEKNFKKNSQRTKMVQVANFRALPSLGEIDHVVFDKTDTLTENKTEILSLITTEKFYIINRENLDQDMAEIKANPMKLINLQNLLNEDNEKENYSEKSQE